MIHTDFHKASSESLSRFSLLFFLSCFFFFSRGAGNPAGKATNNGGDTHAEACEPGPRPRAPLNTLTHPPHSPHSLPNKGLLVGRPSCSPKSEAPCKRKKSYLFNSMLGNKAGGTQSLLSAALDNMVGPVGSHFTCHSYICTQKIKDANSVQSHSITINYSCCCLKWSNLKRPL